MKKLPNLNWHLSVLTRLSFYIRPLKLGLVLHREKATNSLCVSGLTEIQGNIPALIFLFVFTFVYSYSNLLELLI